MNCQYVRYFIIIKYWVKILYTNDNKYVKKVYAMFLMMHGYFKILVIVYCC